MPDTIKNILNRLKEHGETPPAFLLERILHASEKREHEGGSFFIRLNGLKDFSIPPHISQLQKIQEQIVGSHAVVRKTGLLAALNRYKAAAAVLLLFIAGWLLYQSNLFSPSAKKEIVAVPQSLPADTGKTNAMVKTQAASDTVAVITDKSLHPQKENAAYSNKDRERKFYAKAFGYGQKIKPPGENIVKFTDNDLLYTIINCNYNLLQPYLEKGAKKMVVSIDKYSAVTVSDKMLDFMKVMYKTSKKQKPTAKAKKAKATLVKWQKKDEKYFDADTSKTALDIMDLTEFIIDKK